MSARAKSSPAGGEAASASAARRGADRRIGPSEASGRDGDPHPASKNSRDGDPLTANPKRRRATRGSGERLHAEIIAATKGLLAASASSDAVSIRAVAEAVGVTSPSIYLHFVDKDALIEAVVADVFAELDAAMVAAGKGVDEPLAKLRAYGLAYVQFAVEHPEHYRVATMELRADDGQGGASDLDMVLGDAAFTHFTASVTACMDAGIFAQGDPLPVTLELWSAAHGIASLMIAKPYLPWGDKQAFADGVLCSAALGHAVQDMLGGAPTTSEVAAWVASVSRDRT